MKTTYTLIVGDAATQDGLMEFLQIDSIRTYLTYSDAQAAGEAALLAGADSWCIPETYDGVLLFTRQEQA